MKQQLILWISAIILTFLIGYIQNVTDEFYPVTGTFGIEGHKVSYKLDKVHYGEGSYRVLILTDLKKLKGRCIWERNSKTTIVKLKEGDNSYYAEIPSQAPLSRVEYKIIINYNNRVFEIPLDSKIDMRFYAEVPSAINLLHFVLLYGGILLSIRTALEIFNEKKLMKKYSVITTSFFILLAAMISPLKISYKIGAINNYIPSIAEIIEPLLIILVIIWISGTIIFFTKRYVIITALTLLLSTVIIYFQLPLI